jgi:hypothetical protein
MIKKRKEKSMEHLITQDLYHLKLLTGSTVNVLMIS